MLMRILAIAFIFVCSFFAWMILGFTIKQRSDEGRAGLRGSVASTWGAPHEQKPPTATYSTTLVSAEDSVEDGKKIRRMKEAVIQVPLGIESTRVRVGLDLAHRQKGLLWYSTYSVRFEGLYRFRNPDAAEREVVFALSFPAQNAIYDDLVFTVDGVVTPVAMQGGGASTRARVPANGVAALKVAYRSQGLESWRYRFGGDVAQVRDFELKMSTNFAAIDFPDNSLSPTARRPTSTGWELDWTYRNLVSGVQIAMTMPEKLQPGPLAGQIAFFAPVSLFFFFFVMWLITALRSIELHPMNYFFLAAAFFAFHLLLAYLVDHISIHLAFAISAAVSVGLVVSYLRLVVGMRFAALEGGVAQLIYLVLFSYAFFWKGLTGLTITIGAILTLFVAMQMTGRLRWSEKFSRAPAS